MQRRPRKQPVDFKLPESFIQQLKEEAEDLTKAKGYEEFKFLAKG